MQFGDFFFDGDKRVIYEAPIGFSFVLDGSGYRIYTPDDPPSADEITQYDAQQDLWSNYVDYMDAIEWATKAMSLSGGSLRPDGSNATADFQMINTWAVVPANYTHGFIIIGNLSSSTGNAILNVFDTSRITENVVPYIKGADALITYRIETGSGLTPEEHDKLFETSSKSDVFNASQL